MRDATRLFYQFSGAHSLLIGLLPFFLPALMWKGGLSLAEISWFIALGGLSFAMMLHAWDALRIRFGYRALLFFSFLFEFAVVAAIVSDTDLSVIYLTAVAYGAYGCFYWMTQRLLFLECTSNDNTGRKFGNFQIIVTVLLKIGILAGGFLWDNWGAASVFWFSLALTAPTVLYYFLCGLPDSGLSAAKTTALTGLWRFSDHYRSRIVFFVDGLFLFAESFFWVISLYLIANQDFSQLGILVVVLSILLAGLFFVIKNKLDSIEPQLIFVIAVNGYTLSWLMRGLIDRDTPQLWLYPAIVVIAFLTTLFRLVFNKRFFDIAREQSAVFYIVAKSYWSQTGLACLFFLTGVIFYFSEGAAQYHLSLFYYLLAPVSLLFLYYRSPGCTVAKPYNESANHH